MKKEIIFKKLYNKVVVSQYYGNHKSKTTDTYISLFSEYMIKIHPVTLKQLVLYCLHLVNTADE